MKKLLSLALVVILVVALSVGCSSKPAEQTAAPAPSNAAGLKDGTYNVKGTTDERGWTPELTITVSGGKITDAKYDETAGALKTQDAEYQKAFKDQKNIDLLAAYKALQDSLIAKQDPTKIDAFSGATGSSTNFITLATEALKNAKDGDKYKDGEYSAKGAEDERGWTPTVSISVKDGKIATAAYDEVSSKAFRNKSADANYVNTFKQVKNVDLVAAYAALQKSLIDKQDPTKVDAFTGATSASTSFIDLAKKAVDQAK